MLDTAMFSVFANRKYHRGLLVEVHAILNVVPDLRSVFNTVPNLKNTTSGFRKLMRPCDAAVYVSIVIIENLMEQVTPQTRSLVFQQLTEQRDDGFLPFARAGQAIKKSEWSSWPAGMPLLTIVLGHACYCAALLVIVERRGLLRSCSAMRPR
jgi:hypothetical protein